jgi:23S rRNA A2030 N6-methylase RlmJ
VLIGFVRLAGAGLAKALAAELHVAPLDGDSKELVATGVAVMNPPFTLAQDLETVLSYLAEVLGVQPRAVGSNRWIVAEGAKA